MRRPNKDLLIRIGDLNIYTDDVPNDQIDDIEVIDTITHPQYDRKTHLLLFILQS